MSMSIDPMAPESAPLPEPISATPPPMVTAPPADPAIQSAVRREPRRGLGFFATVLVAGITALVVGLVAGLSGYLIGQSVDDSIASTTTVAAVVPLTQSGVDTSPRADQSISGIVSAVLPSVVSILVEGSADSGSGSGFVLRPDGYILTNNHVVNLAGKEGKITVVFNDGTKVKGTVVGTNEAYDLAVVKVKEAGLRPVTLGNSAAIAVGDSAIAIGAPLGLDGTVTYGIISALDRPVTAGTEGDISYINAIQTDAAINPGNSGGPLLDAAGRVIGVNSAIATLISGGEGGSIGLGFAIPVNSAKRIAEEIIATGSARTPVIGVTLDLTFTEDGAKVGAVNKGGPSDDAGLLKGDIIVKLGVRVINDSTELVVAIREYAPGDPVVISFLRGGVTREVTLTLGSAEAS
ncbi:MAG: PDZ domain-containing protein [Candidatus Nanopelagicales bacterium]|nr:PDZ domain-containing protein [Candidatus Nanopelagicales bacterium]